ncbi:5-azacytidine resistance protein azr1 [Corynespora cassiicola Philippines]|uniref:Protein phosphatase n=1 Tax=Corynespora cassiicola Philippines TaxID=1448308 RepID=A0A2T2NCB7_CORCC|nr:5-azacytidine resistance protein azr1 [Corynespora cassiicola Philippines]
MPQSPRPQASLICMTPVLRESHPWLKSLLCVIVLLAKALAAAMSLAIAGAPGSSSRLISRAGSRPSASRLLLVCLSTSIVAPAQSARTAGFHSQRSLYALPICPLNRDSSPSLSGVRAFHSSSHTWSASPHFSYHVAASYSAKGDRFNANRNLFTRDVYDPHKSEVTDLRNCQRHNRKAGRPGSGQDSFFFSQIGNTNASAFGVADGVGGWVESGVDPADFSHGLCEYMACAARSWPHGSNTSSLHPKHLLQVGYDEVMNDGTISGGGSTACLAVAEPSGNVEVANLGDSGFMHLGLNAVRHFTQPQTHGFNTPFQLSKIPKLMLMQMALFDSDSATISDQPKDSSVTHHKVRHGDVLVFATDGVWDNLSPQDVLGIVSRHMQDSGAWVEKDGAFDVSNNLHDLVQANSGRKADNASLQAKLAVAIAKEAKVTGFDQRRDGPFAKEVQKAFPGENWHGGKPDDIAALVAVVLEDSN